ncbi:MAG: periplasmic heavy metal sensor [Planctomycetes bacterium]|nr:periplasmic heavy metal sensor [Planctomycetota bacterium]
MWGKAKSLIIILSIALNIPFIALWATRSVTAREHATQPAPSLSPSPAVSPSPSPPRSSARPPWPSPSRPQSPPPSRGGSLNTFRSLGVSDEQLSEIEPRMARFHEAMGKVGREMAQHRQKFFELIAVSEPDLDAIQAEQAEVLEGHRRMQELVLENMLADKAVLTAEQQVKYFGQIRHYCGEAGRGSTMVGPGTKGGPGPTRKFGPTFGKPSGSKGQ